MQLARLLVLAFAVPPAILLFFAATQGNAPWRNGSWPAVALPLLVMLAFALDWFRSEQRSKRARQRERLGALEDTAALRAALLKGEAEGPENPSR